MTINECAVNRSCARYSNAGAHRCGLARQGRFPCERKRRTPEPRRETPLQRRRAVQLDASLGEGRRERRFAVPDFGERARVGRDVDIDVERTILVADLGATVIGDELPLVARREIAELKQQHRAAARQVLGEQ